MNGDTLDTAALGKRFLETTRGQIVALLRPGARTVEELAQALELTDNAIRNHLSALERDGIVRQEGVRRGGGAGKPAVLFELQPDVDPLFSRAYAPVLSSVMNAITDTLPAEQSRLLLDDIGHRLAASVGGRAPGDASARIQAAADVLNALGGHVRVQDVDGTTRIQGSGCPLSSVVSHRPEVCNAVRTLVADVSGTSVSMQCAHGARPQCCFVVDTIEPVDDAA